MKIDKCLEDVEDMSNEDLTHIRDEASELVNKECVRRDLLGSVDKRVKTAVRLKRETDNLVTMLKRDLSNL